MEALDVAVRLRPADRGGAVFDLLELQEELIGVLVRPTAVLASVEGRIRWIAQDRLDLQAVVLEERQRVIVQDLNGGHRHLGGVEPGPNVAAEAVEHSLDVDLANALERAREEGGGVDLDVPLAVLGVEALQRLDLLLTQLSLDSTAAVAGPPTSLLCLDGVSPLRG